MSADHGPSGLPTSDATEVNTLGAKGPRSASRLRGGITKGLLGIVRTVPWPVWQPVVWTGAALVGALGTGPVRQWQHNFAVVTGRRATASDTRRGLRSWARNAIWSLQLDRLGAEQILALARISPDDRARLLSLAAEPGAVIGLPHAGSWDHAGAWACLHDMPVSTVAERLDPAEWAAFGRLRSGLGFRVYPHDDRAVARQLVSDLRDGRLVCLLCDRPFDTGTVPVTWRLGSGEHTTQMPLGPAFVARTGGGVLLGIATHFEGRATRFVVSEPISADPGVVGRAALAQMMQRLCDFFATELQAHPHDWHMLQPFFDVPTTPDADRPAGS